jgi:hypothetical protein
VAFAPSGSGYRRRRSPVNRAVLAAAIIVVLAAAGVAAWSASRGPHHAATPQAVPRHSSVPSAAAAVVLKPVGASSVAGEDAPDVQNVIEASTATAWHSSYYIGSPHFGGLPKQGVGVVLDMGKAVRLSQVVVQFGTSCCAHAEIEIGNNADQAPDGFTVVATSDTAANSTTFNVTSNATGRYVLIWITYLPQRAGYQGQYQAQIYNVLVRGPAVTQSG